MEESRFWSLLARKLAGEASLRDLYELDKALSEQEQFRFLAKLMTDLWKNREEIASEPGGEEKFQRLIEEAHLKYYLRYSLEGRKRR